MRLLKSSDFNKVNINLWKQNQHLNSLLYIDKLALSEPKSHISLSKVGMAQQQVWKWWRLEAETLKLHCSQDAESAESGYSLGTEQTGPCSEREPITSLHSTQVRSLGVSSSLSETSL